MENPVPDIESDALTGGGGRRPPPPGKSGKMLSALSRGWIMLSIHHYRLIGIILTVIFATLIITIIVTDQFSLLTAFIIIFSLLMGMSVASHAFIIFIERARMFLQQSGPQPVKIHAPSQGTGIQALDLLVNSVNAYIGHLQDTIDVLQESDDTLDYTVRKLTDNLAAAVVLRNPEGKISHCNLYTELLVGVSRQEIYAAEEDFFISIVHPEDQQRYKLGMQTVYSGIENRFRYRFSHRAGIEMWAETSGVPVYDDEGNLIFFVFSTFDVTELERTRLQLQERTREVEDFSYMISHDLKAPLFTLKGMVSIIEDELADKASEDTKEALQHITLAMQRLHQLVESVVDYARITRAEFELSPTSLKQAAEEVIDEFRPRIEETGAKISMDTALVPVLGDNLAVYQILSNLIGNALKYAEPGRTPEISISTTPGTFSDEIQLRIKDNGRGIPAETIQDIFRPFKRAHGNEIAGAGIGLASVKKLMDKMQGTVCVQSNEGEGSEFILSFKSAGKFPE